MPKINKKKGALGLLAGGALVLLSACGIVEHTQYRQCEMDQNGATRCTSRVGLVDNGQDVTYARLIIQCTDGTYRPGAYRQIVGTTSDYGAGGSNPEWLLTSGVCEPGNPTIGVSGISTF